MRSIVSLAGAVLTTAVCWAAVPIAADAAPITFSGSGSDPAGIQGVVDSFRADLGTLNPNVPGSFGSGRREINWDGVPDAFATPNDLPANFFNVISPRGVVFSPPGISFQVSAAPTTTTPVRFGNINPTYAALFQTFSPPRLFTAIGSNVLGVNFFVPGGTTPALSRGFGAVFTDVDLANTTSLTFVDANGTSLGTFFVPPGPTAAASTLSFLGVDFGSDIVAAVRVTSGNTQLGPDKGAGLDPVAMDDFIYGEPVNTTATAAVPEPDTSALLGSALLGLAGLGLIRRSRVR